MAAGDITKKLVEQVRNELNDLNKEIIPTDKIITRKLSEWQEVFMIDKMVQMVRREFDLRSGEDQVYELDDDILTVVNAYYDDGQKHTKARFTINDDDDNRTITLYPNEDSENETILDADVLVMDVFLKLQGSEEMSDTKDPVINRVYFPYLRRAVLAEYRSYPGRERPDLMSLSDVLKEVEELTLKRRMLNMYSPVPGPQSINF